MTRGERVAVLAAVVVALATLSGVGWWWTHRATGGGAAPVAGWSTTRDASGGQRVVVGGGHLKAVIPAGWRAENCPFSSPDCVVLTASDGSETVDVLLMRADPHPVEGDPSLMLFDPYLPGSEGIRRFTVDGFQAVSIGGLSMVLLAQDGTRAMIRCGSGGPDVPVGTEPPFGADPLGGTETPACRQIVDSLTVSWP